jgi:Fur family ferric uptake transcriptional regulator
VIEFCDESIERSQDGICQKQGFQPLSHSLEIQGYCSRCRK